MTARSGGGQVGRREVLLTGAGLVALSACGLPVDDVVTPGLDVDAPPEEVQPIVPEGPRPGMTADEVVRGFLRAGAATGAGLSVARSFLTDDASRAWRPDERQTLVQGSGDLTLRRDGDGYRLEAPVAARIDPSGRFSLSPADEDATVIVGVESEGGEPRISALPDDFGRLLPPHLVAAMYQPYAVHYTATGSNRLVPDLRWIPADQQATRLIRAQLAEVPEYLRGAVRTDERAELTVDAVPVVDGVAQVDLKAGLSSDTTTRTVFAAQVVETLMQLPQVTQVVLTVTGTTLDIPGVDPPLRSAAQLGFVSTEPRGAQSAVVRDGQRVVPVPERELAFLSQDDLSERGTPFAEVPKAWSALAVTEDGKEVAGVRTSGTELVRWRDDGSSIPVPQFADALTKPAYDSSGVLWIGGRDLVSGEGQLWAINTAVPPDDPAARPALVPVSWLGRDPVRAVAISPDRARVAVVAGTSKKAAIYVSGVVRAPNGLPEGTSTGALPVGGSLVRVRDVAWISATALAVLGQRESDAELRPFVVEVGGQVSSLLPVADARWVMTTGGERDLLVVRGEKPAMTRTGASWRPLPFEGAVFVPGA